MIKISKLLILKKKKIKIKLIKNNTSTPLALLQRPTMIQARGADQRHTSKAAVLPKVQRQGWRSALCSPAASRRPTEQTRLFCDAPKGTICGVPAPRLALGRFQTCPEL